MAHTSTHGLIVALFTGVPLLDLAELAAHFLIDYGKCRIHYSLLMTSPCICSARFYGFW